MPLLKDVARYVRSKAAGPFWVTVDIFCDETEVFERVRRAPSLSGETVAKLYGVPSQSIKIFEVEALKVVKISFPRLRPQGSAGDVDSHGGQFFVPLLGAEIP